MSHERTPKPNMSGARSVWVGLAVAAVLCPAVTYGLFFWIEQQAWRKVNAAWEEFTAAGGGFTMAVVGGVSMRTMDHGCEAVLAAVA